MKLPPRSLVSLLSSRLEWGIPQENHVGELHSCSWSSKIKKDKRYQISGIEHHPEKRDEIKRFIRSTFYKAAPIPKALGLSRSDCKITAELVNKEIEDAMMSGSSVIFTKETNDQHQEIVGCGLDYIWTRNTDYDIIGANVKLWHDAASEIAMDNSNENLGHIIWRKLQFLHIYDLGQLLLNQMCHKNTLYI